MTETEQMLFDTFGTFHLSTDQMAKVTGFANSKSVLEAIRRGTFPIRTVSQNNRRKADIRDAAAYLDGLREAG
ncbi:MAG TPA: hypothetical protein VFM97_00525 [Gammaproteobacteria bacterium]|nr:hypothetical protein [Gammaproteobacteria bacterium]